MMMYNELESENNHKLLFIWNLIIRSLFSKIAAPPPADEWLLVMQWNPWFNAWSPHHDLWLTNSWADSRMTILFSSGLKNWCVLSPTENEKTGNYCTQSVPRISAKLTRMHWFFNISATHRFCFSKDQIWSLLFLFFPSQNYFWARGWGVHP